ncbi:M48 family metallopeptidase [Helicobacter cetorum]|uniref:Putative zinc-metallo protease n=1 Tax=Helicobacter cetorum (strain ATCC BAA-540 / CCUG 52418 / MIT 99-5656) TaxID=1163745 RepID=I0EUL2_HELCM|nr:M48 family metallopeptidase [Helicobacter cetorum]AFI06631.1 putative zinc-metallo protease [Helicobacter cetorum MIT 99-5656]
MLDLWVDMVICIVYWLFFTTPHIVGDILQLNFIRQKLHDKPILLPLNDYEEAGNYAIKKLHLSIGSQVLDGVIFAGWVFFGLGRLEDFTHYLNLSEIMGYLVFALLFLGIQSFLSLPISYYTTMHLDKEFGFSKVTLSLFFRDFFKGLSLTLVVGLLLIYLLIMVMEHIEHWEIGSFFVVFIFMVLANLFYPKIAQLFNKFTPLDNKDLEAKIECMMSKVGFRSEGIFVMDASKRDGRLNAYFGGLGKNKRVVLFDTLLSKVEVDGLLAILGHELGHFKHKDLLKGLGLMGGLLALIFAIISHLPSVVFEGFNVSETPVSLIIILLLLLPVFSFYAMPLIGFFSRKNEYAADRFGASLSSKETLSKALVCIVNENKAFPYSHPFYIFLHYTHPPLIERLKALDYEVK